MTNPALVVVTIDGLRARALGAYGNTAYETPSLDQFASQSLVFDRFLAESIHLDATFDALWSAQHALHASRDKSPQLLTSLSEQGYLLRLVTDDPALSERAEAPLFDEVTLLDTAIDQPADEVFDTAIGQTLQAAADVLGEWSAEYEQPRLLWIHLRGLTAAWDAPAEMAASLLDDDDPDLPSSVAAPNGQLTDEQQASDEAFLASCRYAAQVMTLDRCLGGLDGLIEELWPEAPPTVVLAGTRGYALGEHGRLGIGGAAYRELFHAPLLIRGATTPPLQRHAGLMQTSDLPTLLSQLATGAVPVPTKRSVAAGVADDSHFYETDDWSLVTDSSDQQSHELFVQPDDAWQANNIASLCHAEVEQLVSLSQIVANHAANGEPWAGLELLHEDDEQGK